MKIFNYIDLLLSIPAFSGFKSAELYSLLERGAIIRNFTKNQIIYLQNEKANTMDIILEGQVSIENIDANGNVLSIVVLNPGDMLGGNLIFSDENEYPMTLTAKSDMKLLQISKETILNLCQVNRKFLVSLLEIFSDKAIILTTKIHSLANKTIREKIMDFLIFETNKQESNTVILEFSKKELANRFGVERPSLQRELKKMKDEGLVDYDARSITLR